MKTEYLGKYKRPNGYNGDTAIEHVVYCPEEKANIAVHGAAVF